MGVDAWSDAADSRTGEEAAGVGSVEGGGRAGNLFVLAA